MCCVCGYGQVVNVTFMVQRKCFQGRNVVLKILFLLDDFVAIGKPERHVRKLRTVAVSINGDHPTRSLYYCLFAPHSFSVLSSPTFRSW